jgi:AcrR family transcriptional regulator
MTNQKRPYRMKRRAEMEQKTRQRITESLVELHGTVGPARTSISLLARHSGVRRSTIYRHFPDEAALFNACRTCWLSVHPFPEPARWAAIADSQLRLRTALHELYAYYHENQRMLSNLLRDESSLPVLQRMLDGYRSYLTGVRDMLLIGLESAGPHTSALLGHALAFFTWRSLVQEQRLSDTQAADLMCRVILTTAHDRSISPPSHEKKPAGVAQSA